MMSEGADAGNGTAEAIERAVSVIDGVTGRLGVRVVPPTKAAVQQ